MAMNKGALLLITLFLASASLSLAYNKDQLVQELDQCLHICNIRRWGIELRRSCEADCAHDYYTKIQQESQNEENQMTMQEYVQYKLDKCKQKCEFKKLPIEQPFCIQKCEFKYGQQQQQPIQAGSGEAPVLNKLGALLFG